MPKRNPELAALDRRAKAEEGASDLEAFIDAYERAPPANDSKTEASRPITFCRRYDSLIGVELTQVRPSPEDRRWQAILDYQDEMHPYDTFEEIGLADFQGIYLGAHRGVRLFDLYPEDYRVMTERSMFDQKSPTADRWGLRAPTAIRVCDHWRRTRRSTLRRCGRFCC